MNPNRRNAVLGLASLMALPTARAQGAADWPTRGLRIIVPFTAGSPPDLVARAIAPKMAESLGQGIIVENKPGATTIIGTEQVVRSAPDGYTLLLTATGAASVFPAIMKLRFDPIKDLSPVGLVVTSQQVFLSGGPRRVKSLAEFVERARQSQGKVNIGSIGIGTTNHLACELLKKVTGIESTYVPYQSGQAGMQAVINGDVDLFCTDVGVMLGFAGSDRVSAIAVAGTQRSEFLPQTPTLSEVGVNGLVTANRFAIFVPAGIPREAHARLATALAAAVNGEEAAQTFRKLGMSGTYANADTVAELIRSDAAALVPLAKALNIQVN